MKYNILLMLNDSYIKFGLIFLNSLYKNTNINKIDKIIINNVGLNNENKNLLLKKFNKIEFFESNKNIIVEKIHSEEWLEVLTMKTKTLLEIIKNKTNLPIILIDSDMLILKDFDMFIDTKYDIQICKRKNPTSRADLPIKKLDYIGCFVIINSNNNNVINFINDWIDEIQYMLNKKLKPAYETPSMCKMINKYKDILNIGDLEQDKIASDIEYIDNISHIIHMRSQGNAGNKNHFDHRISNIKNFKKEDILKYL
jgi:hypothetical protein